MPKMNCPELIAKLALGNVISKELADRMLGITDDALQVASIERTTAKHSDAIAVKSAAAIAANVASK